MSTDRDHVVLTDEQALLVLEALDWWLKTFETERPPQWSIVKQAADRIRIGLMPARLG